MKPDTARMLRLVVMKVSNVSMIRTPKGVLIQRRAGGNVPA